MSNVNAKRLLPALLAGACFYVPGANAAQIPFFNPYPNLDKSLWYISSGWTNGSWMGCELLASAIGVDGQNIKITLSTNGKPTVRPYSCGEFHTNARTGYGMYETSMKSAFGSGLNSTFFTYIGPGVGVPVHDEIDFEFLGYMPKHVQVNYWVDGVSKDGTMINLGFDASQGYHIYSFDWEPTSITWYVDGVVVHKTKPGAVMPKTPSRLYMSLWSGTSELNSWLGPFNYTGPVSAEYEWVKYTPPATSTPSATH